MRAEEYDIAIIGYGPVGQTMAALLGDRGYRVAVFERWPSLYGRARAGHIDHEIMRIFQSIGAAEKVEEDAHLADQYVFRNGQGETLMSFDYGAQGVSGWRSDYIIYQPSVEDALDASVRRHPNVSVFPGHEAVSFSQDDTGVEIDLRSVDASSSGKQRLGEATRTVRARYLVGADGANSTVREHLGITWEDLGFQSTWLVVDYVPKTPVQFEYDNAQICDPARPHCLFQLGKHHRRFEFAALPGEDPAVFDDQDFVWDLLSKYGVGPHNADIERKAVYTFGSRVASRWSEGRIFLVGDAVHQMPPFMAQGMCSGIRDAMNLTWRIDAVLSGLASESLLDGYEIERAPHANEIVRMSVAAGEISCTFDSEIAAERDKAFRDGTMPPPRPFPILHDGLIAKNDRLAGTLAPQGRILGEDGMSRFDDVYGVSWAIISRDPMTFSSEQQLFLERMNVTTVVVSDTIDVDGTYAEYFSKHGVSALIYRPDFYVYGSASSQDSLGELIDQLIDIYPATTPSYQKS